MLFLTAAGDLAVFFAEIYDNAKRKPSNTRAIFQAAKAGVYCTAAGFLLLTENALTKDLAMVC